MTNFPPRRQSRPPQNPALISDLIPELRETLDEAQKGRSARSGVSPTGEPEWITHERAMMLDATIALLIRHQLPIDADGTAKAVTQAEENASGHSDYTQKWALGCAEYIAKIASTKGTSQKENA